MSKNKFALLACVCAAIALAGCAHHAYAEGKETPIQEQSFSAPHSVGYDALGLRNPFIPLISPEGKLLSVLMKDKSLAAQGSQELGVEGIIYDKFGISYAVVNGDVVKVGDMVSGYYVLRIENKKVIFIKDNQKKEIILKEEGE